MALTFEVVPDGQAQVDGRRYVCEVYSDAEGEASRLWYLAPVGADYEAIATARAPSVRAQFAERELRDAIREDRMPSTRFATGQQMATFLAEVYPQLSGPQKAELCWWINSRLVAGDVSDAQMQNVFTLTAGQWATRKLKIEALAAQFDAVQNAAGG